MGVTLNGCQPAWMTNCLGVKFVRCQPAQCIIVNLLICLLSWVSTCLVSMHVFTRMCVNHHVYKTAHVSTYRDVNLSGFLPVYVSTYMCVEMLGCQPAYVPGYFCVNLH